MTWSFLVLCLSALGLLATAFSLSTGALVPTLDRFARVLPPKSQVWMWITICLLPGFAALSALGISLAPVFGLGTDHCLAHGLHHQHLCPEHAKAAPGTVLVVASVLVAFRGIFLFSQVLIRQRRSSKTARLLREGGELRGEIVVFESPQAQAFVLGLFRPRVHASRALLDMKPELVEPVLAHERAHVQRYDLVVRALAPIFSIGHLPHITTMLLNRLGIAQEMAADEQAANHIADGRVRLAEALVELSRNFEAPLATLAFTHGDLDARVRRLLDPHSNEQSWPLSVAFFCVFLLAMAFFVGHDWIHHGLETFLDVLS
jgi:Zn-dependent protease with chaperone function